jgi:hypothetical protein
LTFLLERGPQDGVFDPAGGIGSMSPAFAYPESLTDSEKVENVAKSLRRTNATAGLIAILSE